MSEGLGRPKKKEGWAEGGQSVDIRLPGAQRQAERGAERRAERVAQRRMARVACVARMLRVPRKSERSLHP